jgi:hypothetical protein
MNSKSKQLQEKIEPIRNQIINHPLFSAIQNIEDIQTFTEFHVYAVWDFMSILKSLQQNLTCTSTPWFPKGNANTRFLINEIVTGEESDIDIKGERKSHFEMYLSAMNQIQSNTKPILSFCKSLQDGNTLQESFQIANTPKEAAEFVQFSFDTIQTNKSHLQAAIFTFGREDLIPNMFYSIVNEMNSKFPSEIAELKYYLDRHIEVDGDHHSHLSIEMTEILCDTDEKWVEAEEFVLESLNQRKKLWDGVLNQLKRRYLA